MTTATPSKTTMAPGLHPSVLARILEEGYGAGAWHGPDLAAALANVTPETAFTRPGPGCHNIAEIALHHAWCVRSVIGQLTGRPPDPFLMEGEDWFELDGAGGPAWPEVLALFAAYQTTIAKAVADLGAERIESPLREAERFDLALGITCHAVYHAGQIQLVKRLLST
jgi:DinB superfamily